MKVAFVFGKGIDGCGVTKGAMIFESWLRENGQDTMVVDFENGIPYFRGSKSQFIGPIYRVGSEDEPSEKLISDVNSCDLVIFHSYPISKHGERYVNRFSNFMRKITDPIKVGHDHGVSPITINSVPQLCDYLYQCDFIVTQSMDGSTRQAMIKLDPRFEERSMENPIWFDESSLEKYRLPFEERSNEVIYVGRTSPLKDPAMIGRLEYKCPMDVDWRFTILGCEFSLASITKREGAELEDIRAPYVEPFLDRMVAWSHRKSGFKLSSKSRMQPGTSRFESFDYYSYDWGMERLGKAKFSWCGYKLTNPEEYGTRMEYTMIESSVLSFPVFNKHFLTNAKSPSGVTWGDHNFLLGSAPGEEEDLLDVILNMKSSEWTERTDATRALITREYDIHSLGKRFLSNVFKHKKKELGDIQSSLTWFPDYDELKGIGRTPILNPTTVLKEDRSELLEGKKVYLEKIKEVPSTTIDEWF